MDLTASVSLRSCPSTRLYYSNARWYDPTLGRFITEDPARAGANWFAYVNNNPLAYIDPTGLDAGIATWQHDEDRIDKTSKAKMATLDRDVAAKARKTIIDAKNAGIDARVSVGYRSNEDQAKAYAVGRDAKGNVIGQTITNAKPGQSPHNLVPSQAFDVEIVKKNGSDSWDYKSNDWKQVEDFGRANGLRAGADWTSPYDPPHFESPSFKALARISHTFN